MNDIPLQEEDGLGLGTHLTQSSSNQAEFWIEDWKLHIKGWDNIKPTWKGIIGFLLTVSIVIFLAWSIYHNFPPYKGPYIPNRPHG